MTEADKAVERLAAIAEGGTFGHFDSETVEVTVGDLRTVLEALALTAAALRARTAEETDND